MLISAVILARGGSKGIPDKNFIDFCNKPLIAWTIEQVQESDMVQDVWVSSDSKTILEIASNLGANTIKRPDNIAADDSTSESGWIHAVDYIENQTQKKLDIIFAPQVTSPLRTKEDIDKGIDTFIQQGCDSLFSSCLAEDLFFWEKDNTGKLRSVNYDFKERKRRQEIDEKYIENGSFYIFSPEVLKQFNNRFGNKIGTFIMESWKMHEIDSYEDIKICEAIMKEFLIIKEN
tara:strand:- start:80 stop:778 length:699 start_codon:yes stop_codon:yes gene_type:complete